jgi:hypothetical protein
MRDKKTPKIPKYKKKYQKSDFRNGVIFCQKKKWCHLNNCLIDAL